MRKIDRIIDALNRIAAEGRDQGVELVRRRVLRYSHRTQALLVDEFLRRPDARWGDTVLVAISSLIYDGLIPDPDPRRGH